MKHLTVKEKEQGAFEKMKGIFHYKNTMAAPKLKKVVLNVRKIKIKMMLFRSA